MKALRAECINSGKRAGAGAGSGAATSRSRLRPLPKWVTDVPYDIRDEAMRDLLKAFKTCFSKGDNFTMKFKSRKAPTACIAVLKKHWNRKRGAYSALFAPGAMAASEELPPELQADSRLLKTKLGRYYLCMPQKMVVMQTARDTDTDTNMDTDTDMGGCENQAPSTVRVAGIDPGVRTFATVYSSNNEVTEWGAGDVGRIRRLCAAYDSLQSRWGQKGVTHAKRRRMKRAGLRIQERVRACVSELHRKLALYLCRHHDVILLPRFETQDMVAQTRHRGGKPRAIGGKTARAMCTWSHYRFQQHLLHKARQFPGCRVVLVSEAFTSKTCGACGTLNNNLGKSKVFRCGSCGMQCDRDVNGARNVVLRAMAGHASAMVSRAMV